MEFEGATSVSQVHADTPAEAVRHWFEQLGSGTAYGLTRDQARRLREGFSGDDYHPVPLEGLVNAWCTTALGGDNLALFNIILTG